MKKNSRTYNILLNSIYGVAASAITIVLNFFVRVVLVRELGEEINGLHTLFQSITNVMLLMELGISSAMIIHLYEPLAQKNEQLVKEILSFYKRIYSYIAVAFSIVSILVAFFLLDSIVTTTLSMDKVRLYFLVFSISFTINYLTYYKRSILFAEQKNRISIGVTALCEIIFRTGQIILVIVYHQYLYFLILVILEKLSSNLICNYYINKHYPYLKVIKGVQLAADKKKAIFDTVKPLFVNQFAGTVQQSSTGIIISILMGSVSVVGYFGNYQLIMMVVQTIYTQFGGSFTTSFGNLSVEKNKERMKVAYYKAAFIMNWMAIFFCSAFLVCASDFIYLVFGKHFVLDNLSVFILALNLVVLLFDIPMISVQNAMGLHRYDSRQMVYQALLTIILSFVLGKLWGMPGIFIGLLIPLVFFTLIRKGVVIGIKALGINRKEYLSFISMELVKIILVMVVCNFLCKSLMIAPSILSILIKLTIAIFISLFVPAILSRKTQGYSDALSLVSQIWLKVRRK